MTIMIEALAGGLNIFKSPTCIGRTVTRAVQKAITAFMIEEFAARYKATWKGIQTLMARGQSTKSSR